MFLLNSVSGKWEKLLPAQNKGYSFLPLFWKSFKVFFCPDMKSCGECGLAINLFIQVVVFVSTEVLRGSGRGAEVPMTLGS